MPVRLDCPLCGATVADGPGEPAPGACPVCGAEYAGGGDSPPEAVAAAMDRWAVGGVAADALARALFALAAGDPRGTRVAITSDRRDGFYRWWLFVRADAEGRRRLLADLAGA